MKKKLYFLCEVGFWFDEKNVSRRFVCILSHRPRVIVQCGNNGQIGPTAFGAAI